MKFSLQKFHQQCQRNIYGMSKVVGLKSNKLYLLMVFNVYDEISTDSFGEYSTKLNFMAFTIL